MENNGRTETRSDPSQSDCQLSTTDVAAPDYAQDLTFEKLLIYCGAKGLALKHDSIVESFNLKNKTVSSTSWLISYQIRIRSRFGFRSSVAQTKPHRYSR